MKKRIIKLLLLFSLINMDCIAQLPYLFIPNCKTKSIQLHQPIVYNFKIVNLVDKKLYLMYRTGLEGAGIEYKFKSTDKWEALSNTIKGDVFNDDFLGYPHVMVKSKDSLLSINTNYVLAWDSTFLKSYIKEKPKKITLRFIYNPILLIDNGSGDIDSTAKTEQHLFNNLQYSNEFTLEIQDYKKVDKKAIKWVLDNKLPPFMFMTFTYFNNEYHFEDFANIELLNTFYTKHPKSSFKGKAKLFEAEYYAFAQLLDKAKNNGKAEKIFWEIIENNYSLSDKEYALKKLKYYYPKDNKLIYYLKEQTNKN